MQHIIIGTAGHIDHGKTTLIKKMTGRDTDTLKEEKERGISINLGFTYFDLPSNRRAGIVDVPGHEKFIKNMLAGVSGIDIVLLIIAADEGIMPQTREHFNILKLLDIKKGIIVVTKKDLVDNEWMEVVTEDIKKEVEGTFLGNSPIIEVSSFTGEGIEKLISTIDEMTIDMKDRDFKEDFRIPVDRVFSVSGFGTVITGTLIAGTIKEGENCEIYNSLKQCKIRGIQVHENQVKEAFAGQRVAINLSSIKLDEIARGDVIAKPESLNNSMMIDCRLNYLNDAPFPLKNHDRIRLYHGTSEILGRVIILDKDEVKKGESALIQIRLEKSISARKNDKYIIRSYSPMYTIGGGEILDADAIKHKANNKQVIEELIIRENGTANELIEKIIDINSKKYISSQELIHLSGVNLNDINEITSSLHKQGRIYIISLPEDKIYLHKNFIKSIEIKTIAILKDFHRNNPLKPGMTKEEVKSRVFGNEIKQKIFDELLLIMQINTINIINNYVSEKSFDIKLSEKQNEIKTQIIYEFMKNKYQPPKIDELVKSFVNDENIARQVFFLLVETGEITKISQDVFIISDAIKECETILEEYFNKNDSITLGQFRDVINTNRKYAVAILEYFDTNKFTKRIGDVRVLYKNCNG